MYHVVDSRKGDIGKNRKKYQKYMKNYFLMEIYSRNPSLSNTIVQFVLVQ